MEESPLRAKQGCATEQNELLISTNLVSNAVAAATATAIELSF